MSKKKKAVIGIGLAIGAGLATFLGIKKKDKIKALVNKKKDKE